MAPSQRQQLANRAAAFLVATTLMVGQAAAQEIPPPPPVDASALQLEIFVNGKAANFIAAARRLEGGSIAVTREDLAEAGILLTGAGEPAEWVDLGAAGLRYRYDEPGQRLDFTLSDAERVAKVYDGRGEHAEIPLANAPWGALLNYSLFASTTAGLGDWMPSEPIESLSLDFRAFSPYGLVSQTGILGTTIGSDLVHVNNVGGLRLETTYTYADPDTQTIYHAGDTISGGLPWTRPIRLGGLQIQRDFALRPDLVTAPLPQVSASAAVPSTVEVLVNGATVFKQDVAEGPFTVRNLPSYPSGSSAQMVVRDASGRQTATDITLISSDALLAPRLFEYSAEAGYARRFYGLKSNDYDDNPVASATGRYGLSDKVTVEGHAELGAGLAGGGAGAVTQLGGYGTLSAAVSYAQHDGAGGLQIYAAYSYVNARGLSFSASTQRTFGEYDDLATVTAPSWSDGFDDAAGVIFQYLPRAIDTLSIGTRVPATKGSASLSFAQVIPDDREGDASCGCGARETVRVLSAQYSQPVPYDGNLSVTGFYDVSGRENFGLFAGVSFPLGARRQASLGAQSMQNFKTGENSVGLNAQVSQSAGQEAGSAGWSLAVNKGKEETLDGTGTYVSSFGTARVEAVQQGSFLGGSAQFDGSAALVGSHFALGQRVGDAFAIVDAGAAGIPVRVENQAVGVTNRLGTLLLPTLRSYERNRIDIDPLALPLDAVSSNTQAVVTPTYRSGLAVDFGISTGGEAVTLIIVDAQGNPVEVGSHGKIAGGGEDFIVGYDGLAYLSGVSGRKEFEVDLGQVTCRGAFDTHDAGAETREVRATCI